MYKRRRFKGASSRITRRSKAKHLFNVFLRFGTPLFLLLMTVVFLRADFIQLKEVKVSGNNNVKVESIEGLARASLQGQYFLVIPKSNMLFFNEDALTQKIITEFKRVESVEISKNINGVLEIKIKERRADFAWCSGAGGCFLMSKDGLVFVPALPGEMTDKIIFRGNISGNPTMQYFTSIEGMQNYLKAVQVLNDAGFGVSSIDVEISNKAVFKTKIGDIFLNPEEDLSISAANTLLLISEIRSNNSSATFKYIDARFGNKVFYKLQSSN